MAKTKWTKAQQQVIDLRDRNILVSAAAGSGKTAVLVERIITMITDEAHPVDIDRLLVVTFTNAAASQMRERIEKAIEEKLMEQNSAHLQKQMMLVHSAQITTIHSFCMNLIRNYFHVIDLDPGFRLADEAELILLRSDVMEELLEQKYEEAHEDFLELVECYSTGKTDIKLEELIEQLYGFSVSYPWPEEWLSTRKEAFLVKNAEELSEAPWMKGLLHYIRSILEELPGELKKAICLCREQSGPMAYLDALTSDLESMEGLLTKKNYQELWETFSQWEWEKLKRVSKKDEVEEEKQEQVKAIRKEVKDRIEELRKSFFFQPPEEMADDLLRTAVPMNTLIDLTLEFSNAYHLKKEEKHILDFNDLEHFALNILVSKNPEGDIIPSPVAQELSEYYEEILMDEYQDSNLVQELLLKSLSQEARGKYNRFMVGDVKQSIYKFRLARPELFMEKYENYTQVEQGESKTQRIDLRNNFRSRPEVLAGANFIFRQIMQKKLGNIAYDEAAALYPGAVYEPAKGPVSDGCECIFVYEEEEKQQGILPTLREMEGKAIAARIRKLVDKEAGMLVYDQEEKKYRPARYGDIVILLRTMTGWAGEFQEILLSEGIPAYTDTQSGYFETIEVKTMLHMLSIIDNPRQDIPLAAVLHSPIGGFTTEELACIRSAHPGTELYDALIAAKSADTIDAVPGGLHQKTVNFLEQLEAYRSIVFHTDIHKLLQKVMEDTGYYRYVSVMPAGEQRKANLNMLVQKAIEFEATSYRGLFHFNRYMERLHKYEIDFGEAGTDNGGENAVRLMSIHKSKGLEFPVVFLAGTGKTFNTQDSRNRLLIHPDMGLGPDLVDSRLRIKTATLLKKVIQKQLVLENLGEELRVLYVAFTRAKEKIILTGFIGKQEETQKKWLKEGEREEEEMPFHRLTRANTYLDWLGPALHYQNSSLFSISYIGAAGLTLQELIRQSQYSAEKSSLLQWDTAKEYSPQWKKRLSKALAYQYPYRGEGTLPGKITVTELKKLAYLSEEEDGIQKAFEKEWIIEEAPVPLFIKKQSELSGAQIGTLYHKFMQWVNFEKAGKKSTIQEELKELEGLGKIKEEEISCINISELETFFRSDLAKRMAKAQKDGKLYREKKFVMGLPSQELYPGQQSQNLILVQGMIDVYFEEGEELVLVDYKTDQSRENQEKLLKDRYQSQFHYYEEALSRLTHKKVKEKYLYSFALGKAIKL